MTTAGPSSSGQGRLELMRRTAFDLSRLTLAITPSPAHPDGICTTQLITCGCGQPALVEPGYCGTTIGHCHPCGYAWTIRHDPAHCWQPEAWQWPGQTP